MPNRILGLSLFYTGVALMFIHTTLPFLWEVARFPGTYPLISSEGILAILPGFSPPLGAVLLVLGGLIYGHEARS